MSDTAIEALRYSEFPNSSDCISRQAAIDEILGQPPEPHYPSWYAEQIKRLPAAQPERMRGRWVPKIDRWGDTLTLTEGYNCSECHAWVDGEYSFCPWCGADMSGVRND